MYSDSLIADSVLKIGEVSEVDGRRVFVQVDKNKNLSDVFYQDDILKNISVNSYIEIRKGYLSIIGKVDGERIEQEYLPGSSYDFTNKNKRVLSVSLSGYLTRDQEFVGGTKELPLIGNEAFILTKEKLHQVHNLLKSEDDLSIAIATSDADGFDVNFPVDGLFNSHIAIFGNTGSGKSNTLASLYQELCRVLREKNASLFEQRSKFLLIDFNGEYSCSDCITRDKHTINLSTRLPGGGQKIPLDQDSLLNLEILSTLADATEKTQKPFLKRTLALIKDVNGAQSPIDYYRGIIRNQVVRVLQMSNKELAFQILDYLRNVIPHSVSSGVKVDLADDIDWHNVSGGFFLRTHGNNGFLSQHHNLIQSTMLYSNISNISFNQNILSYVIDFLYVQLVQDLLSNRAQNEHISPAINKLISKREDIEKVFDTNGGNFWLRNFVVINLHDVNLDMKKTIPLLLARRVYAEKKQSSEQSSLTIIIDEAHNILSKESFREEENWKDYRIETFEEIIKEGRKFGVFVTISSQRPNDISPTITSQAHNYFIHRLINQRDIETISSAVSYIYKITQESIPTLPTGTCIFSGVAGQMPLKINVKELARLAQPQSHTVKFADLVPEPSIFD